MPTPKVSVIIPCYNRAAVVAETIQCVLKQSLIPHEVIAVDDGSTDRTLEVLNSFAPQVKVLSQKNSGASSARNLGFSQATGEYIWFMDSDDLASLNKLEAQVKALEQNSADIAISPWIKCHLQGGNAYPQTHVLQQKGLPAHLTKALISRWSIMLQSALFRRDLLEKVGSFDTTYTVAEDQLFFLKCLLANAKVVYAPECLFVYRTEGVNKLTQDGCAAEQRYIDWARFLLDSRQLCLQAGRQDPSSWFLFRLRLWIARQDLSRCSSPRAREMSVQIEQVLGNNFSSAPYAWAQKCIQWLGGIRQRTLGDRSLLALRPGPLHPQQISLISELGYSLNLTANRGAGRSTLEKNQKCIPVQSASEKA